MKVKALIIAGLLLGGWWGSKIPPPQDNIKYQVLSIKESVPTPDIPNRLIIKKLNVDAQVEQVGKDNEELMDVPKIVSNAGWYQLGVRPGQIGSAVIDGHFNDPELKPEIFYYLNKLSDGDTIIVQDLQGKKWNFLVTKTEQFPDKNFPINEVFGASRVPRLNLITCGGEWDKALGTYNERTVVFSELTHN